VHLELPMALARRGRGTLTEVLRELKGRVKRGRCVDNAENERTQEMAEAEVHPCRQL
jgi:hypothetical protein